MFKKSFYILLLIFAAFVFAGCMSKYMKQAEPEAIAKYKPSETESLIIFMRPSSFGGGIQSSVFNVSTDENVFVGIVSAKTKVAYKTNPGKYLFMVAGESADFMQAEMEGGKTYYALVTPRLGVWKARFSLKPITKEEFKSEKFKEWDETCQFIENTDESRQWASKNASLTQHKRMGYYEKWINKSENERPLLKKEDGR